MEGEKSSNPEAPKQRGIEDYRSRKTITEGLMDVALFSANANQLRYVLEKGSTSGTACFYTISSLIIISLLLQVAVGVLLVVSRRYKLSEACDKCYEYGNYVAGGSFLITFVNVFISSFGGSAIAQAVTLMQNYQAFALGKSIPFDSRFDCFRPTNKVDEKESLKKVWIVLIRNLSTMNINKETGGMITRKSFEVPEGIDRYRSMKTLSQGLMDVALLSTNANQLRYLFERGADSGTAFFYIITFLIIISLILQVVVGVILLMSTRWSVSKGDEERNKCYDYDGDYVYYGAFLITAVNIFITSFGGSTMTGL